MPDIRVVDILIPSPVSVTFDWLQRPDGMLDETQELASAVSVALATDARAAPDDALPGLDDEDRRGWWGDIDAAELWQGWPVGSKLWLLRRAKITDVGAREGATVAIIERYIRACLKPFLDAKVASRFAVTVERAGASQISGAIVMYRGPLPAVALRYQALWDEI
jgi:phage gp46-like protein